jgi:Glycosyl hydrolase family 47
MSKVSLTRRRGARRSHGSHATILIGLVALLVVIAMMLGLLLGTHWSQDTPAVAKLRGAAEAGVHKLLERSKAIRDLDSLVRSYSKEHKEKHDHDDELKEHDLQKHVKKKNQRGTDDDKIPAEGKELKSRRQKSEEDEDGDEEEVEDNGGDLSPSARPKPVMDTSVGKLGPYPYSLDPVPSHIDFNSWKAPGGKRFTEYTQGDSPYTITPETREKSDIQARSRRQHILNAMKFAWAGYSRFAFGHDEVLPQSHGISDNWGRIGTTLVDSLDTLWLFGMKEEFWKARDWVRDSLRCESAGTVSVFETTIRSLGGLLSAYDWSHDEAFLEKAKDLGSRLFHAFDGHEIPNGQVNLNNGQSFNVGWAGNNVILSEAGTIQLEFRYLAKMTNITEYATKSERVFEILDSVSPPSGLLPYFIRNMNNPPSFSNNKLTFGAMADSYYEYMLKVWLQGGKKEPLYRKMYDRSMDGMHSELLQSSTPSGLVYIADKNGGNLDHKMDHLVCFMGGLLALGAYTDPSGLQSPRAQRDLTTAKVRQKPDSLLFSDDLVPSLTPYYVLTQHKNKSLFTFQGAHVYMLPDVCTNEHRYFGRVRPILRG